MPRSLEPDRVKVVLTQTLQTLRTLVLASQGPIGISRASESPVSQEIHHSPGQGRPRAQGSPAVRAWFMDSCGCWRSIPAVGWVCFPTPSHRDRAQGALGSPSPKPGRVWLPTAVYLVRGPAAHARPRPRAHAIKTFWLRAPHPARGALFPAAGGQLTWSPGTTWLGPAWARDFSTQISRVTSRTATPRIPDSRSLRLSSARQDPER